VGEAHAGIAEGLGRGGRQQQDGRGKVDPHQQHHQRARRAIGRDHGRRGQVPGQGLLAQREQQGADDGTEDQIAQPGLGAAAYAHQPHEEQHGDAEGHALVDQADQRPQRLHLQLGAGPVGDQLDGRGQGHGHQQQEAQRQHIGQAAQPQRGHAPPHGLGRRRLAVRGPEPFQRGLQLHEDTGGARHQQDEAEQRGQPPLVGPLGAFQRAAHHLGAALADHVLHLVDELVLHIAAVHPPAQHADQQQQQRRQAQDAVEGHGGAHAQAIGVQP